MHQYGDHQEDEQGLTQASSPATALRAVWTCPMIPEILRFAPGQCPICGTSLEPTTVAVTKDGGPHREAMRRGLWLAAAVVLPLVFLALSDVLSMWWRR